MTDRNIPAEQRVDWQEACRLFRVRCSVADCEAMARLRTLIETGELLVTHRGEVMNPPASAAEGAEAGNLNMPQRHGTGAVPQGGEAQATRHPAAPCTHEWEIVDEGGGGSEFQPPDPAVRQCCLCGARESS